MTAPRPDPFFVGDHLSLDFLNSVAAPWGEEIEWLANGSDLVAWLQRAHGLPTNVAEHFRARVASRSLNAAAGEARALREWFRAFVCKHAGSPLDPRVIRELTPLNQLLAQDESHRQIELAHATDQATGRQPTLRWHSKRHWRGPGTLLLPIAEAIGDLLCHEDFGLVRKCEGPECTLWFLDVSKGHGRRWCSMAVCGNRAKAAAHRARLRQESQR